MTKRSPHHPETPEELKPLVGAEKADAEKAAADAGYRCRTPWEDGKSFLVTQDLRMDRINLHVEGGKVVCAYLG